MRMNVVLSRSLAILAGAVTAAALASVSLYATTYTTNGITLTVPTYPQNAPLLHCEPHLDPTANTVSLAGLPTGSTVRLNWILSSGVSGDPLTMITQNFTNQDGTVTYTVPYPEDTAQWPYQDATSRAIVVSVQVAVTTSTGVTSKIAAKGWKVVCVPKKPEEPGEPAGCTPGYWRQVGEPYSNNDQHLDSWGPTTYTPDDSFDAVFGVTSSMEQQGGRPPRPVISNPTLGTVVTIEGGGQNAMGRHAVAALLNAAHPDVNYPMTTSQVIAAVQAAYASGDFETAHQLFEGYNEIGCSID